MIYTFINFIDSILTKEDMKKLAKAILKAQDVHEESWDGKRYTKTQKDSAEVAVSEVYYGMYLSSYVTLIEESNAYYWNDVQSWAKAILEEQNAIS